MKVGASLGSISMIMDASAVIGKSVIAGESSDVGEDALGFSGALPGGDSWSR